MYLEFIPSSYRSQKTHMDPLRFSVQNLYYIYLLCCVYVCVFVCVHVMYKYMFVYVGVCVDVRGQLAGVSSFLPAYRSHDLIQLFRLGLAASMFTP